MTTTGCASIQPLWQPERFITDKSPGVVYVTSGANLVTAVVDPRVSGDTLYGVSQGSQRPIAISLDHVGVSARRLHAGRTALLVVTITGFTGLAAAVAFSDNHEDNSWTCNYTTDAIEQNGGAPLCGPRS